MDKFHDVLMNQLTRLNIDWGSLPVDSHWHNLLKIISDTYLENDEYRYAMERSLDIASDEINHVNDMYQAELNKINMVASDGIIMTDLNWIITSVNNMAEMLLKSSEDVLLNRSIMDNLIFLNTQKEILFFEKLTLHFECGNSYKCNKGIIINLLCQGRELFSSFTITPYAINGKVEAYIIAFRDITQVVLKDFGLVVERLLSETVIENKQEQVVTWCQALLSDLNDGLLVSELHHKVIDNASTFLEKNVIHQGMIRQSSVLNHMFLHCARNEESQCLFALKKFIPTIKHASQVLSSGEEVVLINHISDVIAGDVFQFLELNFVIVMRLMESFKSSKLERLEYNTTTTAIKNDKKVAISYRLKLVHTLDLVIVNKILFGIKEKFSEATIDTFFSEYLDGDLLITAVLKSFDVVKKSLQVEYTTPLLRCLFYTEMGSTVIAQMQHAFLLNQFDYDEVKSDDEVVKKIKDARLSQQEYNVIISDKHDFDAFDKNILHEISSYINEQFCAVIYLNQDESYIDSDVNLKLYAISGDNYLKKISARLYELQEKHFYAKQKYMPITRDICLYPDKKVMFLSLESHAQTLYLRLLESLGFQVCLINSTDDFDKYASFSFDALLFNVYDNFDGIDVMLNRCQQYWPQIPAIMLSPPIVEDKLAVLLAYGVSQYLFKPFTLLDFIYLIQRCFDNK